MADHDIAAAPEQILLTASGTQAIDLVCRFLIERGDTVLLDDPCYFNFHAMLRAHRARVASVPFTPPARTPTPSARRWRHTGRGSTSPMPRSTTRPAPRSRR
jgi:DNA-binding transcriptional MocR family regulator